MSHFLDEAVRLTEERLRRYGYPEKKTTLSDAERTAFCKSCGIVKPIGKFAMGPVDEDGHSKMDYSHSECSQCGAEV